MIFCWPVSTEVLKVKCFPTNLTPLMLLGGSWHCCNSLHHQYVYIYIYKVDKLEYTPAPLSFGVLYLLVLTTRGIII